MSALSVNPPFPIFTDSDGTPLENGYVWIGMANLDPQGYQINVYWDAALTQIAGQPIRTQNGYPVRNGSPTTLYVNADDYSIRVQNKNAATLYNLGSAAADVGNISSSLITFVQSGTGALTRTVQSKLRDTVSLFDFMSTSDVASFQTTSGAVDVTVALNAAIAALPPVGGVLVIPSGGGRISSTITISKPMSLLGSGKENTNGSRLLKTSAVNGPGILITSSNVSIRDLCLAGQAGNGGDGIVIKQQYSELRNVQVIGMGQDGIRVGDSSVAANSNIFVFEGVLSINNARHGFYFDESTTNAGGGYIAGCFSHLNGGDGFKLDRSQLNTFIGCVSEENTGWGLNYAGGARDDWWIAGDIEGNTAGQYTKNSGALRCNALGPWGQTTGANLGIGCRIRNSGVVSIPNATFTSVTFNTEIVDTDSMFDVAVNNYRVYINSAGPYQVSTCIGFNANATGVRAVKLLVNNSFEIAYESTAGFTGDSNVMSISTVHTFNAGDYIEVQAYQTSGGALDLMALSQAFPVLAVIRLN
jgi:hypothetical protein